MVDSENGESIEEQLPVSETSELVIRMIGIEVDV